MTVRDIEGKVYAVESGEVFLFVLFFLFLDGNYLAIYVLHVRIDRLVKPGLFFCFFGLGVCS